MVSILTAVIAGSLGFLVYLAVPILVSSSPAPLRERVGTFYLKLGARSLKQFAFTRRVLSGYDIFTIGVDSEQKLLEVTLSGSMIGEDSKFEFTDPDNRILRLFNKPVALTFERVPAAIDAELAELGHWVREKQNGEGFWSGETTNPEEVRVDPYVSVPDSLHLVDPIDVFSLVPNGVSPENIKTTEKLTKKRFEKYGPRLNATEALMGLMGFAVGVGAVMAIQFFNDKFLDGTGGGIGAPDVTIPMAPGMLDVSPIFDLVVMFA